MGITIFAGGCRYTTETGEIAEKRCDECFSHGTCDLEPRARELGRLISNQWLSTADLPPPEDTAILYLEYPSAEPAGTIRLGDYDGLSGQYREQGSGERLPDSAVVAWMLVPPVPTEIFREQQPRRHRQNRRVVTRLNLDRTP